MVFYLQYFYIFLKLKDHKPKCQSEKTYNTRSLSKPNQRTMTSNTVPAVVKMYAEYMRDYEETFLGEGRNQRYILESLCPNFYQRNWKIFTQNGFSFRNELFPGYDEVWEFKMEVAEDIKRDAKTIYDRAVSRKENDETHIPIYCRYGKEDEFFKYEKDFERYEKFFGDINTKTLTVDEGFEYVEINGKKYREKSGKTNDCFGISVWLRNKLPTLDKVEEFTSWIYDCEDWDLVFFVDRPKNLKKVRMYRTDLCGDYFLEGLEEIHVNTAWLESPDDIFKLPRGLKKMHVEMFMVDIEENMSNEDRLEMVKEFVEYLQDEGTKLTVDTMECVENEDEIMDVFETCK